MEDESTENIQTERSERRERMTNIEERKRDIGIMTYVTGIPENRIKEVIDYQSG